MNAPAGRRVEFRCPEPAVSGTGRSHPGPLFAVAVLSGLSPDNGDVLELACQRCKQRLARNGHPVQRVIHRYSFTGQLKATVTERLPV